MNLPVMDTVYIYRPTGDAPIFGQQHFADNINYAGIEIINICDWEDAMGFDYLTKYEVTVTALKKYLEEHTDTTYWSAPREEFFHTSAAEKAYEGGFTKVIVEDLS